MAVLLAVTTSAIAGCGDEPMRHIGRTVGQPVPARTTTTLAPTRAPATGAPAVPDLSLPMRVVNSDGGTLIYIPMRVNGRGPYEFVLDTGSSNSSVDRSLVRKLSLPRTGHSHPVQGVTGSGVVPVVKVRRWTLGGMRMRAKTLSVVDLGIGAGGLLGSDELCRFGNVTLDFKHSRLLIHRR